MSDLSKRLRIKASMIALGERIAWGSETALMEEAADVIEALSASVENHQLHMLGMARDRDQLRAMLSEQQQASAAQSAPAGAVLMPPQCTDRAQHVKYRNGWNSCLSEVARLNRVQSMPENWKTVPVKPTISMVEAGYEASLGMPDRSGHARAIEMFDAMLASAPAQPAAQGEFGDAYHGAREDLAIWKRRALEAEDSVRELEARIDTLILDCQGESRMGEPVIPAAQHQCEVQRLREALRDTARWIERLPVPTQGAIRQLERIDAAIAASTGQEVEK